MSVSRTVPKGSDLLVAALENEGVEYVFGIPGEENLDVVESLRQSRIALVLTRHEQAAAFMAATHGRLTGRPGVCLTTLGPGALNLTTGAAYAHLGAMPMIMITGQKPILKARQAGFQIVDIVATVLSGSENTELIAQNRSHYQVLRDLFGKAYASMCLKARSLLDSQENVEFRANAWCSWKGLNRVSAKAIAGFGKN
jgi:acetolactate synthase I/II/III large subunit